ncbi:MAG TPA: P-loop NTPase [Pirellulaceae bacterium]|jgi:pilus assembly protein CpaE
MAVLIASNEQTIAARIRQCLQKQGVECPLSQLVSHESALLLAGTPRDDEPTLVFFGSLDFAPNDLTLLNQLCVSGTDRFKVVAVIQNFGASTILQAVRNGAIDCLNLNNNLDAELRHLFDRLDATKRQSARRGKLFTVISAVGGTGASLVATNLAAAIALREQTCGLLDLHWHGGDLPALLNASPRHTLLSLAGKAEQLDGSMLEQSFTRLECGVHLLAGPEPFTDFRQIRPELIQKVVQLARGIYSSVVADLEDCEHFDQVRTLAASDRIIIVLRPDFVSLVRTKKLIHYLISAQVAREHIALVANRMGQTKEIPTQQLEEALGMRIHHRLPDDPAAANEAINLGVPLVVGCPRSKVSVEMVRLADSLLGIEPPMPTPSWRKTRLASLKTLACVVGAVNTQFSQALLAAAEK